MRAHAVHPQADIADVPAGGTGLKQGGRQGHARGPIDHRRARELLKSFDGMDEALRGEIEVVRSDPGHAAVPVGPGRRVSRAGRERGVYALATEGTVPGIRAGADVGYELAGVIHPAVVVQVSRDSIQLGVEVDLGSETPPGAIHRDTVWLLESLRGFLRGMSRDVVDLTDRGGLIYRYAPALLGSGTIVTGEREPDPRVWEGAELHGDQQLAVRRSLGSRILYLWGPPGTGKTLTLARIVEAHYRAGRRVLVLGPSNAAVDLLMAQVAERLGSEPGFGLGLVLRCGSDAAIKLPSDVRRAVSVHDVALRLIEKASAVGGRRPGQVAALRELHRTLQQLRLDGRRSLRNAIDRCLVQLRLAGAMSGGQSPEDSSLLTEATDLAIRTCRVLGTTLTQMHVSPRLAVQHFDVVIIDEASMVSPPSVLAAAGAARQVVIAGDFQQLPPVVRSTGGPARHWLNRDPFALVGIPDDLERMDEPPYLVMLREQRRMVPEICELVAPAYLGRLETHPSVRNPEADQHFAGIHPLLYIDTSHHGARALSAGTSRVNPIHAEIVADLIRYMLHARGLPASRLREILVVSPFRPQARLLETTLNRLRTPVRPRVGTVHSTQGSEAEVVVLDLTDAPGLGISRFLQADRTSQVGARLLNVALSRARSQIIVVAHCQSLRSDRAGAEVRRVLGHLHDHGRPLDVTTLRMGLN